MILVIDETGDEHEFASATRFSTDEANNLCIFQGPSADQLIHVFRDDCWHDAKVVIDE